MALGLVAVMLLGVCAPARMNHDDHHDDKNNPHPW